MNLLELWLIFSFAVWATAALLPGIQLHGAVNAMVVAAVFGILNFFLGWLIFGVLGIGTLGLAFLVSSITRAVVNAILLLLTAKLTPRIRVASFGWAFFGGIVMSGICSLAEFALLGGSAYRL